MRNHIIISSVLFVVVALMHAIRAWYGAPLKIGYTYVPVSVSWLIAILLLIFAILGILRIRQ